MELLGLFNHYKSQLNFIKICKISQMQNADDVITKYSMPSLNRSGSKCGSIGAFKRYDIY